MMRQLFCFLSLAALIGGLRVNVANRHPGQKSPRGHDSIFWKASKGGKIVYLYGVNHNGLHKHAVHFSKQIQQQFTKDRITINHYYVENDLGYPLHEMDLIHEVSNHAVEHPLPLENAQEWQANHAHEASQYDVSPEQLYKTSRDNEPWTYDYFLDQPAPDGERAMWLNFYTSGIVDDLNEKMVSLPGADEMFQTAGLQLRNEMYAKKAMAEDAAFITMGNAHLTLSVGESIVGVVDLMRKEGWELESLSLRAFDTAATPSDNDNHKY